MEVYLIISLAVLYFFFALWKVDWGVICLSLFFPTYLLRVAIGGVPFTMIELLIYVVILAYFVHWMKNYLLRKRGVGVLLDEIKAIFVSKESVFAKYRRVIIPVWLFVIASVLSLVVVQKQIVMIDGNTVFEGQKVALGIIKGWIIAPVLLFSLYLAVIRDNKRMLDVLNLYSISAVILAVWAIFQMSSDSFITPDQRASGPFESANYLALYIAPALFYSLVRLKELLGRMYEVEKMSFIKRLFLSGDDSVRPETSLILILFLLLSLAMFATKSYAGMIAVFVPAMVYFSVEYVKWMHSKGAKAFNIKVFSVILITMVTLAVAVYALDRDKWNGVFSFEERNSSSVRLEVYTVSVGLLSENWLLGIGPGQFPHEYQLNAERFLGHEPYELNMLHPHNIVLAVWLNLGLLGLIAFCWIIFASVRKGLNHSKDFFRKKIVESSKLKVVGFALLGVVFVHGLVDTPFFKNDLALLFWMIIAVIIIPNHETSRNEKVN